MELKDLKLLKGYRVRFFCSPKEFEKICAEHWGFYSNGWIETTEDVLPLDTNYFKDTDFVIVMPKYKFKGSISEILSDFIEI